MPIVTRLSVVAENKRGALAEICTKLAEKEEALEEIGKATS